MEFPFPALVCDIGGTNARFALTETPGAPPVHLPALKTHEFPGLAAAIVAATDKHGVKPRSVIACGAGPVGGTKLKLTNADWTIDGPAIARDLKLERGLLLNDFEAQALALPTVPDEWVRRIGPDFPAAGGTRVILGPGTGLGIGALLDTAGRFIPVSSEACHIDFGPDTEEEAAFWPHLERVHGRVTTESVMSGPGLVRLHHARRAALGLPDETIDNATIVEEALKLRDGEAARTIAALWRLIARFASDMTLCYCATGGVTLSGGVLPRVADLIDEASFRRVFEDKAPVERLVRQTPTRLVMEDGAVLIGMAAIAQNPDRYGIDYDSRAWS